MTDRQQQNILSDSS